jgi:glycosyltransferase involved in cell wall biosynthesis
MNTSKISVIVPVYNAKETIQKCVASICSQIFTDFELLLIDDGSTDGTGEICEELASGDSRIRVIHKKNGGVSSARNLGIKNSCGNWLAFVDADDSVEPLYLQNLYQAVAELPETANVLVFSGFKVVNSSRDSECECVIRWKAGNYEKQQLPEMFLERQLYNWVYPFAKLYKRNPMEDEAILFDEHIILGEDKIFMLDYLSRIERVFFLEDCDYRYSIGDTMSLSHRGGTFFSAYRYFQKYLQFIEIFLPAQSKKDHFLKNNLEMRFFNIISCLYRGDRYVNRRKRLNLLHLLYHNKPTYVDFRTQNWKRRLFLSLPVEIADIIYVSFVFLQRRYRISHKTTFPLSLIENNDWLQRQ